MSGPSLSFSPLLLSCFETNHQVIEELGDYFFRGMDFVKVGLDLG